MARRYKHLFFDLDHTLWDFDTNASVTLQHLYDHYCLGRFFTSFDHFFAIYQPINAELWEQYRNGLVKKAFLNVERFARPFRVQGCDDQTMAAAFGVDFLQQCAQKTALMPHAIEVLDYLKPHYQMHIITNGFREVQNKKLKCSGLASYFTHVFISENIGAQKPKRAFFEYAIKSSNARKLQSLVIGDNLEVDIMGARNFDLDHVYFNPHQLPHDAQVMHEISSLLELTHLL